MKTCLQCKVELPAQAKFCWNCGLEQPLATVREDKWQDLFDFHTELLPQLNKRWTSLLKEIMEQQLGVADKEIWQEKLYETGFRDLVHRRLGQFAEKSMPTTSADRQAWLQAWHRLAWDLVEHFLIAHGQDWLPAPINSSLLKQQSRILGPDNSREAILDYLQPDEEAVSFFTEFISMPLEKLKNASQYFLFPEKTERIWLIADLSLFGSLKEGFAFTERGLYWKNQLQAPQQVIYAQLQQVDREKEWLLINQHFFHASPSLNMKIWLLLRRFMLFYQP